MSQLNDLRTKITTLTTHESDRETLDSLLNVYYSEHMNVSTLMEQFEDTIFRFDRITLNKLHDMSQDYVSSDLSVKKGIHKSLATALTSIFKHIKTPANKSQLITFIDIFAMELVNPLKRNYLLSGIFIVQRDLGNLNQSLKNEQLFIEN